jgi:hypothetical protein
MNAFRKLGQFSLVMMHICNFLKLFISGENIYISIKTLPTFFTFFLMVPQYMKEHAVA